MGGFGHPFFFPGGLRSVVAASAKPAGTWRGAACSSFGGLVVDGWFSVLSTEGVAPVPHSLGDGGSNAPPIGEAKLVRVGCYDGA